MTLDEYRNELRPSERILFDDFVKIGIKKTIYALLDAKVEDRDIIRVVVAHWNISHKESTDSLINAKINAALDLLWEHLRFQGHTETEADDFLIDNSIEERLVNDHALLTHWNNPEKILKVVQQKKKSKEN